MRLPSSALTKNIKLHVSYINSSKVYLNLGKVCSEVKNSLQICVSITQWLLLTVMFLAITLSLTCILRLLNAYSKYVRNFSQATLVLITVASLVERGGVLRTKITK